ncbi:MAG: GC-type dockerin domain-anchored protein [Phycisphaerales bacterium]
MNNGTLVVNNGTANLGGTCTGLGNVSRTGGTINFTGTYTGPVLTISNATGPINFAGGTLFSGTTLNALDGQTYGLTGGATFNAVTLNAPIVLGNNCSQLTITGGLTLGATGSIATGTSFCQTLVFQGTQAVDGTGTITINNGTMGITGTGAVLTTGGGVTIQAGGNNASIAIVDGGALNNGGRLLASGSSRTLAIQPATGTGTFTLMNQGLIEAFANGFIILNVNATNTGTIRTGTNGTVQVSASRTLTNTSSGIIEVQSTGPNPTNDFGHVRVLGTLVANGQLMVSYPNGLVPGCRVQVPVITTSSGGTVTGIFDIRTGPNKPAPFGINITVTPNGATFTSTNQADIGSPGGVLGPDGLLDNNDFIVFINVFFAQNPLGDRGIAGGFPGSDGLFDNNDFIAFINQFFAGCS